MTEEQIGGLSIITFYGYQMLIPFSLEQVIATTQSFNIAKSKIIYLVHSLFHVYTTSPLPWATSTTLLPACHLNLI